MAGAATPARADRRTMTDMKALMAHLPFNEIPTRLIAVRDLRLVIGSENWTRCDLHHHGSSRTHSGCGGSRGFASPRSDRPKPYIGGEPAELPLQLERLKMLTWQGHGVVGPRANSTGSR